MLWGCHYNIFLCVSNISRVRINAEACVLYAQKMKTMHGFFWQSTSLEHTCRQKSSKLLVNRKRTPEKQKEPLLYGTGGPKDP